MKYGKNSTKELKRKVEEISQRGKKQSKKEKKVERQEEIQVINSDGPMVD